MDTEIAMLQHQSIVRALFPFISGLGQEARGVDKSEQGLFGCEGDGTDGLVITRPTDRGPDFADCGKDFRFQERGAEGTGWGYREGEGGESRGEKAYEEPGGGEGVGEVEFEE